MLDSVAQRGPEYDHYVDCESRSLDAPTRNEENCKFVKFPKEEFAGVYQRIIPRVALNVQWYRSLPICFRL